MIKRNIVLISAFVFLSPFFIFADSLWDSAAQKVLESDSMIPARTVIKLYEIDRKGNDAIRGTTIVTRILNDDGTIDTAIESTGQKPPEAEPVLNGPLSPGKTGIFSPEIKKGLKIEAGAGSNLINTGETVPYFFSAVNAEGASVSGTVWIDKKDACAVKIQSKPDNPAPPLVESESEVLYAVDSEGNWYPVKATVRGQARFLGIKRGFHIEYEFRDYF
jgi:hypothetical protein